MPLATNICSADVNALSSETILSAILLAFEASGVPL